MSLKEQRIDRYRTVRVDGQSEVSLQSSQPSISRRTFMLRLAALTVVGTVGSSFGLLACSMPPVVPSALTSPTVPSTSTSPPLSIRATLYTYRGHSGYVNAVAWSPDGRRIASGGDDSTVQVWDAATGGNAFTYSGQILVNAVAWQPHGQRIASGGLDYTVQVWDAATGGNVFKYRPIASDIFSSVNAVAWSPDGRRIAS